MLDVPSRARAEGVPEEAVLLDLDPNSHAPLRDGGAGARDALRPDAGRHRRLEAGGLVAGERAHVPGHRVRKTVYRLTHDGWAEAMKLRGRFQSDIVEVAASDLDPTPMRVADIPEIFPAYVNLTAAVSLIRRGRLDFTKLRGIGAGAVAPVLWGDTLRRLGRVFGRSDESRALDAWAASPSAVLVVTGIAGIGKSALVASWLVRQQPRPYIFWFEIHDGTTRSAFLRGLAAFLARLGRRGLTSLLHEAGSHAQPVVVRLLNHDLKDLPILVVLDNFQRATPDLARFLRGPILELCRSPPTKVVMISRTVPANLSRRKGPKRPRIEVLRIGGLDLDASLSLLRAKGFAGDEVALQRVANTARGHPILLSFAAQTGSIVSGEMNRYTAEWETAVHSLQAKNLLAPTISGGVIVHDSIREYIRDRLPEARRRSFHSLASAYLLDGAEMHDRLEGLFHLVEAGGLKGIGDYLVSRGAGLLDSVPASELLAVLRNIDPATLDAVPRCVLSEVMGDALRALGDSHPALLEYRHAVQRCEAIARPERIPRLLRKIASIERCRNEPAKALGHLVEARARLKGQPDAAEFGEVLREMALLEKAQGNLAEAAGHMNAAVDLATEGSAPGALVRGLTALGSIEMDRGHLDQGLAYKLEGLRIAERAGNLTETARACISVGTSYHMLHRYEEAVRCYDRALQIARLVGNLRLVAYATMDRCASLMDMGRAAETASQLAEAKRLVQILEERDTLSLLSIYEGQREFELGRWGRATRLWEQGLRGLREFADQSDLAQSLLYVGRFHVEHGDSSEARRYLDESARLARALGNDALLAELEPLLTDTDSPANHSAARPTRP